ncbi:helix-turn-helix transcriptional regulator [Plantactinospora veratri]|uniref:Helix-turn-helix transcriptional regulator n=1 Tax=Plantactinospora veratri TaxID=1436122 RepID=A0ABU7S6F9_9ACTN
MDESEDPAVQARRLRSVLRTARSQAGLTQKEVAVALDWSVSKFVRIENGETGISTNDLKALLSHYGVTDETEVDALVKLARMSRRQLLTPYRDILPRSFINYLGLEATASVLRTYESSVIPGLLQTEEYATAVICGARGLPAPDSAAERMVQVRLERQESLDRLERKFSFIIDEAALHRRVGRSRRLMRRQFDRLRTVAERPNVTLRIVPFNVGEYIGMGTPFVYLEFPGPGDDDLVHLENSHGGSVIRDSLDDTRRLLEIFLMLEDVAAPADQLGAFLEQTWAGMTDV